MKRNHVALMTLCILYCTIGQLYALTIDNNASVIINNEICSITPKVVIKTAPQSFREVVFTSYIQNSTNSYEITYDSEEMVITISFINTDKFNDICWQITANALYKSDLQISDVTLSLGFNNKSNLVVYKGFRAINQHNTELNQEQCPYTDRIIEFEFPSSSFWIVGANYDGCTGIERISDDTIYFYDHSLHFTRLSGYQTLNTDKMLDTKPVSTGNEDSWSFLIFEDNPFLIRMNRWFGNKKAAFGITNDADGESTLKLPAAYFGSNNVLNSSYLNKGLVANHIKVTNTVFGGNIYHMRSIWNSIKSYGNTIGYHTYSDTADSSSIIRNSLLNGMCPFNVRVWVDHSLPYNPEDFGCLGTFETTPFFILDIINESNIDYVWLGDSPVSNPFNAFDEPWRLPHKLPFLSYLTKPVYFFGRTRMESWEYFDPSYNIYSMKYNLTKDNLDKLLTDCGLCVGYAHFSFDNNSTRLSFFDIAPNGDFVIRSDVNDLFGILDYYQNERDLWIDTVENIFDRMLAVDKIKVTEIMSLDCPGFVKVSIENNSDDNIEQFYCEFLNSSYLFHSFEAHTTQTIIINTNNSPNNPNDKIKFSVFYNNGYAYIRNISNQPIPAAKATVYNIKGQRVNSRESKESTNYISIPIKEASSGVYIVKIDCNNMKSQTFRISIVK